jgi:hypothetical protein
MDAQVALKRRSPVDQDLNIEECGGRVPAQLLGDGVLRPVLLLPRAEMRPSP